MPAHESAHGPALHFFIVIRRPTTPALYPAIGYGFVSFHINHGEIGIVAKCQATFVAQIEYALRAMRSEINKALQAEAALIHMVQHDGHKGLHTCHARW